MSFLKKLNTTENRNFFSATWLLEARQVFWDETERERERDWPLRCISWRASLWVGLAPVQASAYPFAIIFLITTSYCLANIAYSCYKGHISLYFQQKTTLKNCIFDNILHDLAQSIVIFLNSQNIVSHISHIYKKKVCARLSFCAGGWCRSSTLTHCLILLATSLIFDQPFLFAFFCA